MKTPFPKFDPELVAGIEEYFRINHATADSGPPSMEGSAPGLLFHTANGRHGTPEQPYRAYSRPMFQIFDDGVGSAMRQSVTPCPDCDDWSRTSKCAEHYELAWNAKTKRWDGRPYPEDAPYPTAYYSSSGTLNRESASILTGLYEQVMATMATFERQGDPYTTDLPPRPIRHFPPMSVDEHRNAATFSLDLPGRITTSGPPTIQVDGETLTGVSSFVLHVEAEVSDGT